MFVKKGASHARSKVETNSLREPIKGQRSRKECRETKTNKSPTLLFHHHKRPFLRTTSPIPLEEFPFPPPETPKDSGPLGALQRVARGAAHAPVGVGVAHAEAAGAGAAAGDAAGAAKGGAAVAGAAGELRAALEAGAGVEAGLDGARWAGHGGAAGQGGEGEGEQGAGVHFWMVWCVCVCVCV